MSYVHMIRNKSNNHVNVAKGWVDFQAFVVDMATNQRVNEMSSNLEYVYFGILDLTGGKPKSRNGCVCLPCRLWSYIGVAVTSSHWPSLEWLFTSSLTKPALFARSLPLLQKSLSWKRVHFLGKEFQILPLILDA